MTDYELVNPSDPIGFSAPDRQIATIVTVLLGEGHYAAETSVVGMDVPMFLFGGFDEFWAEAWPDAGDLQAVIQCRKAEVVSALRSVAIGSPHTRAMYRLACAAIDDPQKLQAFRQEMNDSRTSTNNIMGRALALADWIEDAP